MAIIRPGEMARPASRSKGLGNSLAGWHSWATRSPPSVERFRDTIPGHSGPFDLGIAKAVEEMADHRTGALYLRPYGRLVCSIGWLSGSLVPLAASGAFRPLEFLRLRTSTRGNVSPRRGVRKLGADRRPGRT